MLASVLNFETIQFELFFMTFQLLMMLDLLIGCSLELGADWLCCGPLLTDRVQSVLQFVLGLGAFDSELAHDVQGLLAYLELLSRNIWWS
eukprot:7050629-Pyramimonas_sp.AAC.1